MQIFIIVTTTRLLFRAKEMGCFSTKTSTDRALKPSCFLFLSVVPREEEYSCLLQFYLNGSCHRESQAPFSSYGQVAMGTYALCRRGSIYGIWVTWLPTLSWQCSNKGESDECPHSGRMRPFCNPCLLEAGCSSPDTQHWQQSSQQQEFIWESLHNPRIPSDAGWCQWCGEHLRLSSSSGVSADCSWCPGSAASC